MHISQPGQTIQPQPMHMPTGVGAMQPISTSTSQPSFFGGTGTALFQGTGGVVVEGSGTAMYSGQGITAFGGEGSAHFQFGDDTVYVQSVEGGGFVGIAEGDGQATFVGQGIAAGVGTGMAGVMGTGHGAVVGNGHFALAPYPQNRYQQAVAVPYRPYQQRYYPAHYYKPAPVYYY